MAIKVTPKQFAIRLSKIESMSRPAIVRGLRHGARRGQRTVAKRTPVDLGGARNAWDVQEIKDTMRPSAKVAKLINDLGYVRVLEEGARPHPVSAEGFLSIWRWCQRNGVSAADEEREIVRYYGYVFEGADVAFATMAYLITRQLAIVGQDGQFFVKSSVPSMRRNARKMVVAELGAVIKGGGK